MKITSKASWWSTATQEQKLAQIKGGIECGMSSRQVGINVGAAANTVSDYGKSHGHTFPAGNGNPQNARAAVRVFHAKRKPDLTDTHFNIFGLGDATHDTPDYAELSF